MLVTQLVHFQVSQPEAWNAAMSMISEEERKVILHYTMNYYVCWISENNVCIKNRHFSLPNTENELEEGSICYNCNRRISSLWILSSKQDDYKTKSTI
jgi:hypothetical protein